MERNKILILSGATATGKTDISIELARKFPEARFEVINYDSLLFYNELNIGTAKPSKEELASIPHHLINISSISHEINANDYVKLCTEKVNQLHAQGKTPVLTGGSTFYLRSFVKGMYESEPVSERVRKETEELLSREGIEFFWNFLQEHDPESIQNLHINDHYRVTRAYEHFKATGTKLSEQKEILDKNEPYNFDKNIHPNIDFEHISLLIDKEKHWEIMKSRANKMVKSGLIEEVQEILKTFSGDEKPLASIGYKETIDFLKGQLTNTGELAELIYINTRKLAKAQKTFLKKVEPKKVINPLSEKDMLYKIVEDFIK
ncbi:tRNA (adenosine(37)-N6)-dimethylallyltransferase MiaA [Bacteriovorax sp. Seq25_V]|uniref:tRNA (adenosine(37)-N6)-dimethylallyltransferase MiaA n=1 Tax=Bacteriovorax sp. Seq25_V TaxID=1201288 RepID=UPI00038A42B4|nr:tRNA (adenosine(37)-N6)-dimethylallyltransferase MiaA [Bacteriovorax sp. Seq25_V]EQC45316.1 tRNA dimethylallyltransferase [Bacteriovorax sp. Seq25_V]